jgi:nicotinamide riboside transporter PnuC
VFAKIIGVVTAIIIFFLYFKWRSADPVLETMFGILLALLGGYWAWWATGRRQRRMEQGEFGEQGQSGEQGGSGPADGKPPS